MGVAKVLRDCCTENDGVSYDAFRVAGFALSALGVSTFIAGVIYSTVVTGKFDMAGFALGFGGMMSGLAVLATGVALKQKTDIPKE